MFLSWQHHTVWLTVQSSCFTDLLICPVTDVMQLIAPDSRMRHGPPGKCRDTKPSLAVSRRKNKQTCVYTHVSSFKRTWMRTHAYTIHLCLSDSAVFGSKGRPAGTAGPWGKQEGESGKRSSQVFQHLPSLKAAAVILFKPENTLSVLEHNKGISSTC